MKRKKGGRTGITLPLPRKKKKSRARGRRKKNGSAAPGTHGSSTGKRRRGIRRVTTIRKTTGERQGDDLLVRSFPAKGRSEKACDKKNDHYNFCILNKRKKKNADRVPFFNPGPFRGRGKRTSERNRKGKRGERILSAQLEKERNGRAHLNSPVKGKKMDGMATKRKGGKILFISPKKGNKNHIIVMFGLALRDKTTGGQ